MEWKKPRILPLLTTIVSTFCIAVYYNACSSPIQFTDLKSARNSTGLKISMSEVFEISEGSSANFSVSLTQENPNPVQFVYQVREVSLATALSHGFRAVNNSRSEVMYLKQEVAPSISPISVIRTPQKLSIPAGSTNLPLSFEAKDNSLYSGAKYYLVSIENVKSGDDNHVGGIRSIHMVVRINEDEPIPVVDVDVTRGSAREGSPIGQGPKFRIKTNQLAEQDISVEYYLAPDTAVENVDYENTSGVLQIRAGQLTSDEIEIVTLTDDITPEPNKQFYFKIRNASENASLGTDSAIGIIEDDPNYISTAKLKLVSEENKEADTDIYTIKKAYYPQSPDYRSYKKVSLRLSNVGTKVATQVRILPQSDLTLSSSNLQWLSATGGAGSYPGVGTDSCDASGASANASGSFTLPNAAAGKNYCYIYFYVPVTSAAARTFDISVEYHDSTALITSYTKRIVIEPTPTAPMSVNFTLMPDGLNALKSAEVKLANPQPFALRISNSNAQTSFNSVTASLNGHAAFSFSSPVNVPFANSNCATTTIAPNSDCYFYLNFTPQTLGEYATQLQFSYYNATTKLEYMDYNIKGIGVPKLLQVIARYPYDQGRARWTRYIVNNGSDLFSALGGGSGPYDNKGTECSPAEVGEPGAGGATNNRLSENHFRGTSNCLHTGEMFRVVVENESTCRHTVNNEEVNLQIMEYSNGVALNLLNWECRVENLAQGNTAVFYSSTLKQGRGLRDIIDFESNNSFKDISVQVTNGKNYSEPYKGVASKWWLNPVELSEAKNNQPIVSLNEAYKIYILKGYSNSGNLLDAKDFTFRQKYYLSTGWHIAANNISVVTGKYSVNNYYYNYAIKYDDAKASIADYAFCSNNGDFAPSGTGNHLLLCSKSSFLWIEGDYSSSNEVDSTGIKLAKAHFTRIQNSKLYGAKKEALKLIATKNAYIKSLRVENEDNTAVLLTREVDGATYDPSEWNYFEDLQISGGGTLDSDGIDALRVFRSDNNYFYDTKIYSRGGRAIRLNMANGNRFIKTQVHETGHGIFIENSNDNIFSSLLISNIRGGNNRVEITATNSDRGVGNIINGATIASNSGARGSPAAEAMDGIKIAAPDAKSVLSHISIINNWGSGIQVGASNNNIINQTLIAYNSNNGLTLGEGIYTRVMQSAFLHNQGKGFIVNNQGTYIFNSILIANNDTANCDSNGSPIDSGTNNHCMEKGSNTDTNGFHLYGGAVVTLHEFNAGELFRKTNSTAYEIPYASITDNNQFWLSPSMMSSLNSKDENLYLQDVSSFSASTKWRAHPDCEPYDGSFGESKCYRWQWAFDNQNLRGGPGNINDAAIFNMSGNAVDQPNGRGDIPTKNNAFEHNSVCPVALSGTPSERFKFRYHLDRSTHAHGSLNLRNIFTNALEIIGDEDATYPLGIGHGNENGLCEVGEACIYTPHIGSYIGSVAVDGSGNGAIKNCNDDNCVRTHLYPDLKDYLGSLRTCTVVDPNNDSTLFYSMPYYYEASNLPAYVR